MTPDANTLKINRIFWSCQGEGQQAGRPAVFVRFCGCSLRCEWCDTREAWDQGRFLAVDRIRAQIRKLARQYPPSLVVLTGGEPLEQPPDRLQQLVHSLKTEGRTVAIETNGLHPPLEEIDWWTISPKGRGGFGIHPGLIDRAREVKLVTEPGLNLSVVRSLRKQLPPDVPIYLQPRSSRPNSLRRTFALFRQTQSENIHPVILGFQLHKLYNIP